MINLIVHVPDCVPERMVPAKSLPYTGFFQQMGLWFSTATRGVWQQAAQTVGGVNLKAPLCKGWAKILSEDAYKAKSTLKYLVTPSMFFPWPPT